jgi:hypothetical protein
MQKSYREETEAKLRTFGGVLVASVIATALLVAAALFFLGLPRASGADDPRGERDRAARAALALAGAERPAAVATAPAPREAAPKNYPDGYKAATDAQKPMVVYVSCAGPQIEGAVTASTPGASFGDVRGPAVVVCYPEAGRMRIDVVLPANCTTADIRRAVDAAIRKSDLPPRATPSAPVPLNWQIRSTPGYPTAPPACVGTA